MRNQDTLAPYVIVGIDNPTDHPPGTYYYLQSPEGNRISKMYPATPEGFGVRERGIVTVARLRDAAETAREVAIENQKAIALAMSRRPSPFCSGESCVAA